MVAGLLRRRIVPAYVLLAGLVLCLTVDLSAARKVRPGDRYTNRSKLFTITVPNVCSPMSMSFVVSEGAKKGDQFYEEASFYISDIGEFYRVGMRRLTHDMREQVQAAQGPLSPSALAWLGVKLHLGDREKRTGQWRPVSPPEPVDTKHGSGVMSVNYVDDGRFLEVLTLEMGKLVAKDVPPAVVVVLVVQSGDELLYATGQSDGGAILGPSGQGEAPTFQCVQREIWKMFEGLVLSRPVGRTRAGGARQ